MSRVEEEAIMRSIVVILVLSPLIIVLLGAHAQGGDRSLRDLLQAPVGHRQPTVQDAQDIRENSSADRTIKKIDEDLKKKLQGICRGVLRAEPYTRITCRPWRSSRAAVMPREGAIIFRDLIGETAVLNIAYDKAAGAGGIVSG
jgi:hypothetical protein